MLAAPMVPLAPMMAGLNQFGWRAGGNYELMAVQMVAAKALKIADELAEKTIYWLAEKLAESMVVEMVVVLVGMTVVRLG